MSLKNLLKGGEIIELKFYLPDLGQLPFLSQIYFNIPTCSYLELVSK